MKKKWMLSAIGVLCLGLLAGCDKPVESTPVFSAPSSVPTSAPAVASHEPEQAHTPLPAPQLHELQSYAYAAPDDLLITLYVGNHATETEIPTKLPTREDGGTSTFACEEGILAIAAGTGAINIHISQDDGANWEEYNLEGADPAFAPRDIGFVTPQDGWLVLEEHITGDNKRNIIYTTGDAGASWQPVSPLDAEGYIFTAVFASPEVAWLTMYNESPSRVGPARFSTWETFDRGMTWQPVQALYTQDMLEGLAGTPDTSIDVTAPEWSEDAWSLWANFKRSAGYPSVTNGHRFKWDGQGAWIWDNPGYSLPDGISEMQFIEYVYSFWPPLEYDATDGLDEDSAPFYLPYDTAEFLERVGRLVEEDDSDFPPTLLVPPGEIEKFALYWYGDNSFDATLLPTYDPEREVVTFYDEHGKYSENGGQSIRSVQLTATGDIEVILDNYIADWTMDPAEVHYESSQRCVFRPAVHEGVQMFTLLSSEEVPTP